MSKQNPKNKEEAFTYQFEDDVKLLFSMSQLIHRPDDYEKKKDYQKALDILKAHIQAYEDLKYK